MDPNLVSTLGVSTPGKESLDDALKELAAAPRVRPSEAVSFSGLEPGAVVGGSFRVERKLGEGGMGVVYLAYDVELERPVALKLQLRGGNETAIARMAREARAMARVSHPNVVPVHEVGEHEGSLFIAMEYVEGGTVRAWLEHSRTWREVVALFVQAGRGLHAAHAIELVHRDFKPDNVLVGEDGRARVADFGLARAVTVKNATDESAVGSDAGGAEWTRSQSSSGTGSNRGLRSSAALNHRVTKTGTTVGTVAYMAPEQWVGAEVDARADQFSFCVTLFEALYGVRPFAGRTAAQLLNNVQRGRIVEPPAGRRVPRRLLKILHRGLAADPGARFPTMLALLDRLEKTPLSRGRVALSLTALSVAAVAGAAATNTLEEQPCTAATEDMRELWSEAVQSEAAAAASSHKQYIVESFDKAQRILSDYSAAWIDAYSDACEATLVRKAQPEALFALRAACLTDRQSAFARVVEQLRSGETRHLEAAVDRARSLPALEPCANTEALARLNPLPADPATRTELLELRAEIAEVHLVAIELPYAEALEEAHRFLEQAQGLGYRPTVGAARLGVVTVQERANRFADDALARQAFDDGLASGDIPLAARAAAILTEFHAPKSLEEAHRWASTGTALLDQIHAEPLAYLSLLRADAVAYGMAHDFEAAQPLFERIVELQRAHDPEDPGLATAFSDLAVMWGTRGDIERAADYFAKAHAITEATLGSSHPSFALSLANLGRIRLHSGEHLKAVALFEQARDVQAAAYGDDYPAVAVLDFELADLYAGRGEIERGLAVLRRAVPILRTTVGQRLPARFDAEILYAQLLSESGFPIEAQRELDQTIAAIREHELPISLAVALTRAANLAFHRGDHREAVQLGHDAVDVLRGAGSKAGLTSAWLEIGQAHLGLREWDEAVEAFEAGHLSAEGRPGARAYGVRAKLGVAEAHERAGKITDGTIALVREALATAQTLDSVGARESAREAREWLKRNVGSDALEL